MQKTRDIGKLKEIAKNLRKDILRMLHTAGSGHTGGSLSAIDILATLYFSRMRHSPDPSFSGPRDRFILSKGHGAPALYAVLAESGYFDKKHLMTLRKMNSILSGHPYSPSTPGVEVCTGSLGQGLSIANGMAMALKLNKTDEKVFCMMGDGETQEGQVWEAAMTAAHYKLDNVTAFLDNNGLQIDGVVKDIMGIEPIGDKWRAFGWEVFEIDGHDFGQILDALDKADRTKGKPSLIWAHTVKGKGVSFMENKVGYHGKAPDKDELDRAMAELDAA
ncbi:MAG: transketolase [Nitrospinota bacterium]|nr:transketolase [Nitrospinota bacterium]MDH5678040.1 transketolase [Nitrospinota bacterium]MDH5755518.1 transketolase [Nitrospinota bacterium]